MKELDAKYNPHDFEDNIYQKWVDNNLFSPEVNCDGKPYTIMMQEKHLRNPMIHLLIINR